MDLKVMKERVKALSDKVKMQQSIILTFGAVTVPIMITILGMFMFIVGQMSDMNRSIVALDLKLDARIDSLDVRLGSLETKVDSLDVRLGSLETKVDNEISELRDLLIK